MASVGSGIFTLVALLVICVLVLLLLRRFLPLRSTPGYLSVPVFLAVALPASVVLLVPIDLASSTRTNGSPPGIWLPPRVMLVSWRIAYWLTFVLTWAILPLLGEYVDSGYRTPKDRILYSLRSNGRYQLIVLGCGVVGLIYVSIQNGLDFTSLKALVMALAYVWGLILAIYLMGHGLVAIPRSFVREANVGNKLRRIQARAPRIHDRLLDAMINLEELEFQVSQLRRRRVGISGDCQEWIDELIDMTSLPEPQIPVLPGGAEPRPSVPAIITDGYLADLTRRLSRERHQKVRFVDAWERLVQEATNTQSIINSSASKQLEFDRPPSQPNSMQRFSFLTPYMRYHLHVNIIPLTRLLQATIFSLASICVIWSELIKSFAPNISIVSLTVVHKFKNPESVGFWGQIMASAWILYMCSAALVGVNDARVWGNRALVPRNTYGESACWYAGQIAKLTVPLSYNFLTFLPREIQHKTTFYDFLGQLINLTPLGKGFDYFFPIFILVPVCATLFNLYGKVRNIFGFGLLDEDDYIDENADGFGTGGWREGRELIERELNGRNSLGLASRSVMNSRQKPGPVQGRTAPARPAPTIRVPREDGPGARRYGDSNVNSTGLIPELTPEDEEENIFQSFAHRIKNTLDTARPRWLQGESSGANRPRWMGRVDGSQQDSNTANSSGLGRWFGGRSAGGKLRL